MKIFITAPSLDMKVNVSGIAALVAPLVSSFPDLYVHLRVGTEDGKKAVLDRFSSFLRSIFDFLRFRFSFRGESIGLHLNTACDAKSVSRDFLLALIARLVGVKLIAHIHGGYWMTSDKCPLWGIFLFRVLCSLAEKVVVLGVDELTVLQGRFSISRNVIYLHNYAAPDFFRRVHGYIKNKKQIIFAGRLVESKRAHLLPEIMRLILLKVPDATLVVCGDGPLKKDVLSDFNNLPKGTWEYAGVVVGEEKIRRFYESDVFLLPSSSGEGMPVSLLEALAAGCIPVVTRLGAIPSVVDNRVNGYISSPDDLNSVVDYLLEALISNERENVRLKAIESSRAFTIDNYFAKLKDVYVLLS